MIGGGVLRYLSVHNANNKASTLTADIKNTKMLIGKYDIAEQKFAEVTADQSLLTPVVRDEVNWPAVVKMITVTTPTPVAIVAGQPTPPAPPRSQVQIATVSVGVSAAKGCVAKGGKTPNCAYAYFESWANQLGKSNALQLTTWSPFDLTKGVLTYTATLGVSGTVQSSRPREFEVLRP